MKKKFLAVALFVILFVTLFLLQFDFGQEVRPQEQTKTPQLEKSPEKIVPSPQNIKQATAIYVFVAWMWLAIIILIYFLRLKIKEVDRLHRLGYFSGEKK